MLCLIVGSILGVVCSSYYNGSVELYFRIPQPETSNLILYVTQEFLYLLGLAIIALIIIMVSRLNLNSVC
jgi:hypothetical protein